ELAEYVPDPFRGGGDADLDVGESALSDAELASDICLRERGVDAEVAEGFTAVGDARKVSHVEVQDLGEQRQLARHWRRPATQPVANGGGRDVDPSSDCGRG